MSVELLSPAGDFDALKAAVQNGADAVYLGTGAFNARRSAANFDGEALRQAVDYCHMRCVRVHVTLNTMVKEDELPALENAITEIYASGADAFIIQDLGVARIAAEMAPDMELHASTQMAVHSRRGVEYLASHGFSRVVLAREMTLEEIRACSGLGIELETFAHGALCTACSGQCLMSSMIGGRSGNRGLCAQPCRMLYRMGNAEGYLLSTRDLMTAGFISDIAAAGVGSLKIEGRLKRAEYVAVTTRIYRRVIDGERITSSDIEELKQIFNRGGFTDGYYYGAEDSRLLYSERPNNAGQKIGNAVNDGVVIPDRDVLDADNLALRRGADDISVRFSARRGEKVRIDKARKGDILVRYASGEQLVRARESYQKENRPVYCSAHLMLKAGANARLLVTSGTHTAEITGDIVQSALNRPLDRVRVEQQLRKTGGTGFVFDSLTLDCDDDAFFSVSAINALRREALDELRDRICRVDRRALPYGHAPLESCDPDRPVLRAQSGDVALLKKALSSGADEIVFAPDDMRMLDKALELGAFAFALPPVLPDIELDKALEWINAHIDRINAVYMSNVAHLALDLPVRKIGDFTLNMANDESVRAVGADEYTPSLELTLSEIGRLGGKKEFVVYGNIPVMYLRHCPKRASRGIQGKHAGCRMCDKDGGLEPLTDRTGAEFALKRLATDSGCVIRVMNSVPLNMIKHADKLRNACAWRMLIDNEEDLKCVRLFRDAIDGRAVDTDGLKKHTTGHYFRGVE